MALLLENVTLRNSTKNLVLISLKQGCKHLYYVKFCYPRRSVMKPSNKNTFLYDKLRLLWPYSNHSITNKEEEHTFCLHKYLFLLYLNYHYRILFISTNIMRQKSPKTNKKQLFVVFSIKLNGASTTGTVIKLLERYIVLALSK